MKRIDLGCKIRRPSHPALRATLSPKGERVTVRDSCPLPLRGEGGAQRRVRGSRRRFLLALGVTRTGTGRRRDTGMSLLEVLMAVALLGISFAAIFSGLSAALRATDHLDRFDRANEFAINKLNELFLDPSVGPQQRLSGGSLYGIWWEARTELVEARPLSDPRRPAQLVRIVLQVSWPKRLGRQTLNLETYKLCIPQPPPNQ